jgi:hypothetical protein
LEKNVAKKKDCNGAGMNHIFASAMRPLLLRNSFKEARQGLAALCLSLILAVQAMAAVPALHALVHDDSSNPSHRCVVTMFLHGQVHASSAAVDVARSAPAFADEPFFAAVVLISADVRFLPCRGSPSLRHVI